MWVTCGADEEEEGHCVVEVCHDGCLLAVCQVSDRVWMFLSLTNGFDELFVDEFWAK